MRAALDLAAAYVAYQDAEKAPREGFLRAFRRELLRGSGSIADNLSAAMRKEDAPREALDAAARRYREAVEAERAAEPGRPAP